MEVFKGFSALGRELSRSVVTVGNFDGVHLGHREIIQLAIQKARKLGGASVVYTFRPHPRVALRPDLPFRFLNTYDEKIELIRSLGPDLLIEEPFSREFSTMSAEQFFGDVVVKALHAEALVVGHDFGFGRSREGHLDTLTRFCNQTSLDLTIVSPFKVGEEVVSSSKIRAHLDAGQLEAANALLGYRFGYRGLVIKGDGRGRTIGFPTCNLSVEPKLDLPFGVYATWATLADGKKLRGATNIGVRPTFEGAKGVQIETHLLDFWGDLYGQQVELQFVDKVRDEKKFGSIDELKSQIAFDIERIRQVLT